MKSMQQITTLNKYKELTEQKDGTFLIKLYAPWCSRCKKLESALGEHANKIDMYKLNIDADPFIDEDAFSSVSALPCVWIYKQGKKIQLNNPAIDVIINTLN
jgi:thioredoxin-like negative regulator of GroEL